MEKVGSGIQERSGNPLEKLEFPSAPRAEPRAPVGVLGGSGQLLLQGAKQSSVSGQRSPWRSGVCPSIEQLGMDQALGGPPLSLPLSSLKTARAQSRKVRLSLSPPQLFPAPLSTQLVDD